MPNNDGTVKIGIDLDEGEFKSGLSKLESSAKKALSNMKKAYSGTKDALEPVVKGFKAVEDVGKKAGETIVHTLEGIGAASLAAAAGAAAIGKSALDAYADYEQLVGGVETLFKDSAWTVEKYARNAYKTAGLSANEYMETVTSFSASLLQSLDGDTEAAAHAADMAITDMADNANKMGTAMESIQNAYQGFAKQNYTMLDNLKLGYGGTKAEMERLLADAEKLSGVKYDLSSYADIVEAIHVVQTEMGITGTTAMEAASTIQGSVATMKAAWQNFLVGIATADYIDDYEALVNDLVESVVTAGNNIVPRIQEIAERAIDLIPYIVSGFSQIIPEFARMGGEIIQTLANGFSQYWDQLYWVGSDLIKSIANGIEKYAPSIGDAINELILFVGMMVGERSSDIVSAGTALLESVFKGFMLAFDSIEGYIGNFVTLVIQGFASYHEALLTMGLELLETIGRGIVNNKEEIENIASTTISNIAESLRENAPLIIEGGLALLMALVDAIVDNIDLLADTAIEIIVALAEGPSASLPVLLEKASEIVLKLALAIIENAPKLLAAALQLVLALVAGIAENFPKILESGRQLVEKVKEGFAQKVADAKNWGKTLIQNFIDGILEKWNALRQSISNIAGTLTGLLSAGSSAKSSGGSSGGAARPRSIVSDTPVPLNEAIDNAEGEGISLTASTLSRAAAIQAFESAMPAIVSQVSAATAQMAPASAYSVSYASASSGMISAAKGLEEALQDLISKTGDRDIVSNLTAEMDGDVVTRKVVRRVNDMTVSSGKPVLIFWGSL